MIEGGKNRELQRRSGLIPDAVVVTSNDAKDVIPRRQVCISNVSCAYRPTPVDIIAFEFLTELHPFWGRQAESRVLKLQILGFWRET